jgi:hypothetical protein
LLLSRKSQQTHILLELWVAAGEFKVYVAGEVLEAGDGEGSELLAGLVSFWMKLLADGEEGDWDVMRTSGKAQERGGLAFLFVLPANELVVYVCGQFVELLDGEAGQFLARS